MLNEQDFDTSEPVALRQLSEAELDAATGGLIPEMVARVFDRYMSECLYVLTREGTEAHCPIPR